MRLGCRAMRTFPTRPVAIPSSCATAIAVSAALAGEAIGGGTSTTMGEPGAA